MSSLFLSFKSHPYIDHLSKQRPIYCGGLHWLDRLNLDVPAKARIAKRFSMVRTEMLPAWIIKYLNLIQEHSFERLKQLIDLSNQFHLTTGTQKRRKKTICFGVSLGQMNSLGIRLKCQADVTGTSRISERERENFFLVAIKRKPLWPRQPFILMPS